MDNKQAAHVPFGTESPDEILKMAKDCKIFKSGFQAGLKKAAEIVSEHIESIAELASAEVKATAKTIECIILKEISDDSSE